MTRARTTWTNPDGLIVGFGPNLPETQLPAVSQESIYKSARLVIDAASSTLGPTGAKISLPAGSLVLRVAVRFLETHVGGTSITFGDSGNTAGYVTAAQWSTPSAGSIIQGQGTYLYTATEGVLPGKGYATATDLYFTRTGTYTAGKALVTVEYV